MLVCLVSATMHQQRHFVLHSGPSVMQTWFADTPDLL